MKRLLVLAVVAGLCRGQQADWPAYGGGGEGIRYSSLKQIDRGNVAKLQVAWIYDCADGAGDPQTQPVVVDGVLYGVTPQHKVVALDAATGKLLWRFDSGIVGRGPNRAVTYWSDGAQKRIFAGVQSFVYALDAKTGKPIQSFGVKGRIDLREGLGLVRFFQEEHALAEREILPERFHAVTACINHL